MRAAEGQIASAKPRRATALVLCGGGGHGALEVGFAQALEELGIRYDRILGTSIGALNGAFLAGGMSPADLARLWRQARLRRLVRPNWRWLLHPRTQPGLLSFSGLTRFLRHSQPARRFEDLKTPLTIVTTDLVTGSACYWEDEGDIIPPLLASMSVPGIFPPITLNGHPHMDGGIADNAPLGRAEQLGCRRALMIECACANPCREPPRGADRHSRPLLRNRARAQAPRRAGAPVGMHRGRPCPAAPRGRARLPRSFRIAVTDRGGARPEPGATARFARAMRDVRRSRTRPRCGASAPRQMNQPKEYPE